MKYISADKKWLSLREQFYGKTDPSITEASEVYRKIFESVGIKMRDFIDVARNEKGTFLAFLLER